ncbi:MAG: alpha/beta family hydrolase [Halobacteriales archaeon]|nr:alpha/beta family hydrolase [Halobacteriales archaeon]
MTDSETVLVPGAREVRATLDSPDSDACVVACPPHPQMGGKRTDTRLEAVSDYLAPEGATLRFDYGTWDEGEGELTDAENAVAWARDRYDRVALFGYSFGGCIALLAAAGQDVRGVAALAPASRLSPELDAVTALDSIDCPGYVCYGERDTTAEWEPVVERAREVGFTVESLSADHHFVGQSKKVAQRCGGFLRDILAD